MTNLTDVNTQIDAYIKDHPDEFVEANLKEHLDCHNKSGTLNCKCEKSFLFNICIPPAPANLMRALLRRSTK